MKYNYKSEDAKKLSKHGIDLLIYGHGTLGANVCHVSVESGHFEEFSNSVSHFLYYIIEGSGVFILNDEKVEANTADLITIPPNTRIHYFGTMKMLLVTTPSFNIDDEIHVRDVDRSENPLLEES